jgi:fucose permease
VLFFLSGIAAVFIGQVLPILGRRFALDDLRLGYFFQAQFAGSLAGTFVSGWFGRRGRLADSAWIGGTMMAAGILAMNADSYAVVLAAFLLNGIGIGMTLPSINLIILELNPQRSAAALSVLNFCWGVGAIVCKPFVDLTAGETSINATTLIVATALGSLAALVFAFRQREKPAVTEMTSELDTPDVPIWTTSVAWAIAAFNFIHVGFESGMGGWLTTYAARLEGSAHVGIFSPTFLFFLCFVIGRAIAPVFFRFLDENKMLLGSLVTMLIGMVIAITAKDLLILSVGSAMAGLGTSSVFPTNVSRFYRIFGGKAMQRATPLFLCGTLGGAAATYSIGYLSDRFLDLRIGMFVLLFNVAALIAIQIVLTFRSRYRSA